MYNDTISNIFFYVIQHKGTEELIGVRMTIDGVEYLTDRIDFKNKQIIVSKHDDLLDTELKTKKLRGLIDNNLIELSLNYKLIGITIDNEYNYVVGFKDNLNIELENCLDD